MLQLVLTLLVLVFLFIFFAWLARRAWRSRRAWIRWPGVLLGGLAALLLLAVIVVGAQGLARLYMPVRVAQADFQVDHTPENIARGEHIAETVCAGCHGPDRFNPLPLAGGDRSLSVDVGLPLGEIYGANLTPGGAIDEWTDAELARAIRQRVDPDNRPILMPAVSLNYLSDEDLAAVIAYLRTQPAVESRTPPVQPSLLTALLIGAGVFDPGIMETMPEIQAPPKAVTAEYGKYLVDILDCRACHGEDLTGGDPPISLGSNLTYIVPGWSEQEFVSFMRTGVNRSGREIDPNLMPWIEIGRLDEVEMSALYTYLAGLESRAHGK